jgi:hypothetical protein
MEILIQAEVFPTESVEKVKKAISKLFDVEIYVKHHKDRTLVVGVGNRRESIRKIYTLIRSQSILDTSRQILKSSKKGNTITFELNKQAAYMGIVNFFDTSNSRPPLGTILVEIRSRKIDEIIEWLAPSTILSEERGEGAYGG